MPDNAAFDEFTISVSIIVVSKRYLHGFGGFSNDMKCPDEEIIRILDHLNPRSGWKALILKRPLQVCGSNYGLIDLTNSDGNCSSVFVFGGYDKKQQDMDGCMISA